MVCALRGGMARSGARAYAARAGGGGASRCRSTVTVGPDRRRPPRAARRVFGVQFARRATAVIPSRSSSTARRRVSVSVRVARIAPVASPRVPLCSTLVERFRADFCAVAKVIPRGATLATVASIVASMGKLASMGCPTVDVQTLAPQALTTASTAHCSDIPRGNARADTGVFIIAMVIVAVPLTRGDSTTARDACTNRHGVKSHLAGERRETL